ncbi:MAG: 2Fe-2S iron-sulfur cluster-binding protein, partial [Bacteroidetes bacterium]|nr:2Fe-2S iron-sulfur cluster-binding protein [Bacteroidota bacterium]
MVSKITLEVFRYRPDQETQPSFDSYEVPCEKDWVILDALNHIKDQIDGTLSYRWSCRMGVCGSCGMMVNGEPVLTCATFLNKFLPGPVKIEPLEHFPVVRDLVIEMSDFIGKLQKVKPWIVRKEEKSLEDGEYIQ